jgi:ATP-dependent DNA helicase RecQ
MDLLEAKLAEVFGYQSFRPGQREVIDRLLQGRHTLAVFPTGAGKSLCYQLTAQLLPGITLVVSPLIALMEDQVEALARRGVHNATCLSSAVDPTQIAARYSQLERGQYKLVYIAPERCDSPRFQQFVRSAPIDLLVIDEAHCISQWGHDFRPHYRSLSHRLPELKRATVLALTATATPAVQDDIVRTLDLPAMQRVVSDFNRPNLRFEVVKLNQRAAKDAWLLEALSQQVEPAIIYTSTRKEAERVFEVLTSRGLRVCLYHAGLMPESRAQAQRDFQYDRTPIMVATVAFGMGIDKPNIRRIIHHNIPGSLESYYQEAGRGGRDGAPATCTLLYSQSDVRIQRFFIEQSYPEPTQVFQLYDIIREAYPRSVSSDDLAIASQLRDISVNAVLQMLYEQGWVLVMPDGTYAVTHPEVARPAANFYPVRQRKARDNARLQTMLAYTDSATCRRVPLLQYFGQTFSPPCHHCDVCAPSDRGAVAGAQRAASLPATAASDRVARVILHLVSKLGGRLGQRLVRDVLLGSKRQQIVAWKLDRHEAFGQLEAYGRRRIAICIDELIGHGLLRISAEEYPRLKITPAGRQALEDPTLIALAGTAEPAATPSATFVSSQGQDSGSPEAPNEPAVHATLYERLRQWRSQKAQGLGLPAYCVLHNRALTEIAHRRPTALNELAELRGIGARKIEQFGQEIIDLVHSCPPSPEPPPSTDVRDMHQDGQPLHPHRALMQALGLPPTSDLRLQLELFRQGGPQPDCEGLLRAVENGETLSANEMEGAIQTLAALEVREAVPTLAKLLGSRDGTMQMCAAEALGQLGAREAIPRLAELLEDDRPGVRRAALRALGRLRAREALDRCRRLASEEESAVVRVAAQAAVMLMDSTSQSRRSSIRP